MAQGYFITGTDTGAGKTLIACAMLHAFARKGFTVIGMKPVAAGSEGGRYADVDALVAASTVHADIGDINPYAYDPPIAPHIAAEQAGEVMNLDVMAESYRALARQADVVIVEGSGGFMIPLNANENSADLACILGLPVVLVVGMRLGCLNHALLTRRAIAEYGLRCAGWICNTTNSLMRNFDENRQALIKRLDAPLIGTFPQLDRADASICESFLDLDVIKGAP